MSSTPNRRKHLRLNRKRISVTGDVSLKEDQDFLIQDPCTVQLLEQIIVAVAGTVVPSFLAHFVFYSYY